MIKAVIFDFDGLIVDTETLWYEVYSEVFREEGGELPLEEWAKVIGTTFEVYDPFSYLSSQLGREVDRALIQARTSERYQQRIRSLAVRPGVEDYLKAAQSLGLRIGLSSSSTRDWVESYLKPFGLLDYFEALSTKEDVKQVKPEPDLYLRTMKLLDVEASEIVVFEDSLNGLKAALAAKMCCVVVPNQVTKQLTFTGANLLLESMADMSLEDVLRRIS